MNPGDAVETTEGKFTGNVIQTNLISFYCDQTKSVRLIEEDKLQPKSNRLHDGTMSTTTIEYALFVIRRGGVFHQ